MVSARSEEALRAHAGRVAAAAAGLPVADVAATLAGRTAFEHRGAVAGASREQLVAGLLSLAEGAPAEGAVAGAAGAGKTVLVFPGQGSQWDAMARELYAAAPPFRARLEECARALSAHADWDLLEVLLTDDGAPLLARVDVVQPALFAVMVSLAALWESHGLKPDAVVGHSQGEIAAACVAGALSLPDAARVVALRSQAIRVLAGRGGMVSVALPAGQVRPRLARWGGDIGVAAVNGPASAVVSGSAGALDELQAAFEADGVRTWRIPVDYASHSRHVDEVRDRVLDLLAPVRPRAGRVRFYSTVTARQAGAAELGAEYWFRNLRGTVEFEATVRLLLADGYGTFIECSPHPVLAAGVQEAIDSAGAPARGIATLRRDHGDLAAFLRSAGEAFTAGAIARWNPGPGGHATLPAYPFQRARYWLGPGAAGRDLGAAGLAEAGHPLLGAVTEGAASVVFTGRISLATHPWLAGHEVAGTVVLPGAAFVELAVHAADRAGCGGIRELTVQAPLVLPEHGAVRLRVEAGEPAADGARPVRVDARPDAGPAPGPATPPAPWTPPRPRRTGTSPPGRPPAPSPPRPPTTTSPPAATATAPPSRDSARCGATTTTSTPRSPSPPTPTPTTSTPPSSTPPSTPSIPKALSWRRRGAESSCTRSAPPPCGCGSARTATARCR